jgi:putative peptide zinc metalloprotease protein
VLADGATLRVGDTLLTFERSRAGEAAGRTVVVPAAPSADGRPRLQPGVAIKRLADGERRWVVHDPRTGAAVRMPGADAALVGLLDGAHTMDELVAAAVRRHGPCGPLRLAQILASLAERGLLVDVAPAGPGGSRLARLLRPRDYPLPDAGALAARLYRRGGRLLLTPVALAGLGAVGGAGLMAFVVALATGTTAPFVVADRYWLGGVVFVLGRLLLVSAHELAHGLVLVSFGRNVRAAGLKLVLVFPYAFVDTSEAWLEPRRRRIAVSAAGPACDLALGGACGFAAAALGGVPAQIAFHLALAAYVGAFYNLNPLLDRDGYHVLVDVVGEPNLRRRARERLVDALAGGDLAASRNRLLLAFGIAVWCWSLVGVGFAALVLSRLLAPLGAPATWVVCALVCAVLAAPALVIVIQALARRRATRKE